VAKKYDFRPDPEGSGDFGKLLLTKLQRRSLMRWSSYAAICVFGLLLQDVFLSRVTMFGARTDIVPCLILMICTMQGAEIGSVFALTAACLYYFSGSAPGPYVIPVLVGIAVFLVIFRQSYLKQGFLTILICAAVGMIMYEICIFCIGLFLERTTADRFDIFVTTALISLAAVPVAYPILMSIGKLGGDTWKE
jgi:hypothetical protein